MEINVGSSSSGVKSVELRRKLHLKVKKVDTTSLRELGKKLKTVQQLTLVRRFGNILRLMEVDVQEDAITALAQYYDSPLRCFTFQDFQLAPTLEEFEQILDLSLEGQQPYRPLEHYASLPTIANVLRIHPAKLQQACQERHQNRGFTRDFLERHIQNLASNENCETFMDVLALTIYGIVLFPKHDNFVDLTSIDVFLAPHIFKRPSEIKCPITDLLRFQIGTKSGQKWANHLASLNEGHIRWHTPWQQSTTIVYHCGNYPNVSLMGTRGCINYNPVMGQRQLAYPMMGPLAKELLTPFVFYYEDENFTELIQKVKSAWAKVIRKGKELGVRSCAAKASYREWVNERVQDIKLPFKAPGTSQETESSNPEPIEDEEVKELKAYEEVCKKHKSVQSHASKVQRCLEAASKELGLRVKEWNVALYEKRQLKGALYKAKGDKQEALTQVNELQA
ncbi:uncharacterized protein LOC113859813 [Abrus precatorius]|uniref:Uncharacterized protein LOC113859813 n=1 Tax=Abrus precatorius TaxID=3816 RepID=A0A8B8KWG2_ABRPR|nr:uncharacterized protein LOC113859813 [Abrus precatorius]